MLQIAQILQNFANFSGIKHIVHIRIPEQRIFKGCQLKQVDDLNFKGQIRATKKSNTCLLVKCWS